MVTSVKISIHGLIEVKHFKERYLQRRVRFSSIFTVSKQQVQLQEGRRKIRLLLSSNMQDNTIRRGGEGRCRKKWMYSLHTPIRLPEKSVIWKISNGHWKVYACKGLFSRGFPLSLYIVMFLWNLLWAGCIIKPYFVRGFFEIIIRGRELKGYTSFSFFLIDSNEEATEWSDFEQQQSGGRLWSTWTANQSLRWFFSLLLWGRVGNFLTSWEKWIDGF